MNNSNSKTVVDVVKPLVAADLLKETHPVHQSFNDWCVERSTEPTKRQAAKFLQAFPAYRNVKVG